MLERTLPLSPGSVRLSAGDLRPDGPAPSGVARLGVGEPDFETPEPIVAAGMRALRQGWTHDGDLNGDPELRALAADLASGVSASRYTPEQVLISNGATSAVTAAISTLVSPGDRVVLLDPSYSLFGSAVLAADSQADYVALDPSGHLDLEQLGCALVGARALVIINPANPVGTVYRREELEALAEMCRREGTIVIADEVCDHFIFDDRTFTSCLNIGTWREQLIYIQSLSKTYAMTGWRVGYLIASPEWAVEIRRLHRTCVGAVNAAAQRAAITALTLGDRLVAPMRAAYQTRRDLIVDRINTMPSMSARRPEGGFFVMARYSLPIESFQVASALKDHGVVVRPGREFGPAGEGHLRISIATAPEQLTVGLDRIEDWFATFGG
jgi:aspartate/methionine/tyrosine aminotransferase